MTNTANTKIKKLDEYRWLLPKTGPMRVPGLIFSNEALIKTFRENQSLVQVANVASLPGIVGHSLAMPDIHWGYGFPIGGVAATDVDDGGVISPGGVGFDICCGVRLLSSHLTSADFAKHAYRIMAELDTRIPRGAGKGNSEARTKVPINPRHAADSAFDPATDLETGILFFILRSGNSSPPIPKFLYRSRGLPPLTRSP